MLMGLMGDDGWSLAASSSVCLYGLTDINAAIHSNPPTGTISLSDLEQFCPEIDFKTPCSNAPVIEAGACLDGYYLSAAWSTKASLASVALAMAAAAALLF